MEKPGCSSSKLTAEEELKVDQNEFGDESVTNTEQVGFQGDQSDLKEDGLVNGVGGPALAIFPEEVWEVILNKVDNSEDVHNVLLAFPELDKAFQSKKALWLFGAVLPYLMTKHLAAKKYQELFKLRLVSKRWKVSVESSLKGHAQLEHLPQEGNQKLMPSENHLSYHPLEVTFGATIFRTGQQINKFLNTMCHHPGNPFPGRYIFIKVSPSSIDESLALFEKFGEHVLFLVMDLVVFRHDDFQLCQHVLECLSHTPNLRSLTITGALEARGGRIHDNFFCKPESNNLFPDLPKLEAFNWLALEVGDLVQTSSWITHMIQKYGGKDGLGKLSIVAQLDGPIPSGLESLTELNLVGFCEMTGLEFTEYAFSLLPNPHKLRKFRLLTGSAVNVTELMSFLAGYEVETLILDGKKLYEEESWSSMGMEEVTSIKSLHLTDVLGVSYDYDFFKGLPNLEFLTIHFELSERWGWRDYFKEEIQPGESLAKRIRGFVLKVCDKSVETAGSEEFSVWMELPQLKMLTVRVTQKSRMRDKEDSVWNVKFLRECGNKAFFGPCSDGYEKLHEDEEIQEEDGWNDDSDSSDDSEELT